MVSTHPCTFPALVIPGFGPDQLDPNQCSVVPGFQGHPGIDQSSMVYTRLCTSPLLVKFPWLLYDDEAHAVACTLGLGPDQLDSDVPGFQGHPGIDQSSLVSTRPCSPHLFVVRWCLLAHALPQH